MVTREEVIEWLEEAVAEGERLGQPADYACWDDSSGVILTREEAQVALGALLILQQQDRMAGRT